jgi:hypothetical protein
MLRFSEANTKLKKLYDVPAVQKHLKGRKIYSFDMLSGISCPGARDCKSRVVIRNGKRQILDGAHTTFRCFSASQEALYTGVYNLRKSNLDLVKTLVRSPKLLVSSLESAMPTNAGTIRIHVSGDMINYAYFKAWCTIALNHPDIILYAYTKSLPFWIKARDAGIIPDNLRLTASRGGLYDRLIDSEGLREARVVFSKKAARKAKLELDTNDYHAWRKLDKSFGLLIHGQQSKGSEASVALQKIMKEKRLKSTT